MGMEATQQPAVLLQSVSFGYGKRTVLDELSLTVSRGSIFGLLGANGAGKTTLIRLLVGLARPRSGNVEALERTPSPSLGHLVGYMPQRSALYLELSARENVDFFGRMSGLADRALRRQSVEDVFRVVDLWDRRGDPVVKLSGGMRQRVSLACALVHRPELIILDEPTVGLDPELRASFWEHFQALARSGATIVLSSHTMDDAAHCDVLAFLRDGRVIAQGSPDALRAATGEVNATLEDAFLYHVRRGQSPPGAP
jgi:ABC-2 type transport system ATP-binding protein